MEGREMCWSCYKPAKSCFCHDLKSFHTTTRFVLLMHPKEAKKNKTGTGRISHLCLKNSEILIGVDFSGSRRFNELINDDSFIPFVLYPGESSYRVDYKEIPTEVSKLIKSGKKRPLVFILDGTWPCAKKMMLVNSKLHGLPRLSFSSSPDLRSQFTIKHQPSPVCLSTIESIFYFLKAWRKGEYPEISSNSDDTVLLDGLAGIVNFQIKCALDPHLKSYRKGRYKTQDEKRNSIKWDKRKLFFEKENFQSL